MHEVKVYYKEIVLSEKQNKAMRLFSTLISQHDSTSKWKKKWKKHQYMQEKKEKGLNYPKRKTSPYTVFLQHNKGATQCSGG